MTKLNSDLQDEKVKMLVLNTEVKTKPHLSYNVIWLTEYFCCNSSLLVIFILKKNKNVISKLKIETFFLLRHFCYFWMLSKL